jgi:hypothetical protein
LPQLPGRRHHVGPNLKELAEAAHQPLKDLAGLVSVEGGGEVGGAPVGRTGKGLSDRGQELPEILRPVAGLALFILVQDGVAGLVEDAQVHGPGVQIDATVE